MKRIYAKDMKVGQTLHGTTFDYTVLEVKKESSISTKVTYRSEAGKVYTTIYPNKKDMYVS